MTIVRNSAEGQTSGTALTTGNSGGGSGTAFTTVSLGGGTAIFSTAAVAVGVNGYRLTALSTAAILVDLDDTLNSSSANTRAQVYFTLPSIASQVSWPFGIRNTAANIGAADIDSTGHIRVNIAVPSVVAGTFSTGTLSAGVLYRAEILGTGFGTASTTITVNVYAGTTATLVATCTVSGTTSTVFNRLRVGKVATGSATGLDFDEPAIEMGGTTEIGPPAAGAVDTGTGFLGLGAQTTAVHVLPTAASGPAGIGAQATTVKVTRAQVTAGLALAGTGTARKLVTVTGRAPAGFTGTSTVRKLAVAAGRAPAGFAGSSTARKLSVVGGTAGVGLTAVGTLAGALTRAVVVRAAAGLSASATGRKLAAVAGRAPVGVFARATLAAASSVGRIRQGYRPQGGPVAGTRPTGGPTTGQRPVGGPQRHTGG